MLGTRRALNLTAQLRREIGAEAAAAIVQALIESVFTLKRDIEAKGAGNA